MNAYSEDLRKKIVEALRRGITKSEAARTFGVSRSSVKRYAKLVEEGRPLTPKKRPGSKPKMDERATKLLEADVERHPAATLSERREFLQKAAGVGVSDWHPCMRGRLKESGRLRACRATGGRT